MASALPVTTHKLARQGARHLTVAIDDLTAGDGRHVAFRFLHQTASPRREIVDHVRRHEL